MPPCALMASISCEDNLFKVKAFQGVMGERHALLIGMDFFQDEKLSRLLAPKDDVYALREALLDSRIGAFDSAEVLFNSDLVPLQSALHNLFDGRAPDDLLLLYYTGHGLIDRSGALYLSLHNSNASTPSIGSLEADFVRKRMKESHAEAQIVVLDCCHSGAFMDGAKRAVDQQAVTGQTFDIGGKGQYILSACSATEFAFEAGQLREGDPDARPRSIFTECFVNGLTSGDAAPQSDTVSIDSLYHYTRAKVLDRNMPMDPQRWISGGSGDLVLANNPDIRIPVPTELRNELLDGSKFGRLGAIDALGKMLGDAENPFQAHQAREILEEGLKSSEWVEVKDAILAALGRASDISEPPLDDGATQSRPDEAQARSGDLQRIPPRTLTARWFLAGGILGAAVCLVGVYAWWSFGPPSDPTIPTALRTENATNAEALRQAADVRDVIAAVQDENLNLKRVGVEKDQQIEALSEIQSENERLKGQIAELEEQLNNFDAPQQVATALEKDPEGRITSWSNPDDLPDLAVLREKFSDGTFAPEMIVIPTGTFLMGSPSTEEGRSENEDDTPGTGGSQVQITFTDRFAIGRTEVTFAEWDVCTADGGCNDHTPEDRWGRGDQPVIHVSWNDAQSYVAWLNKKVSGSEDGPYGLPSESQWEYAARARTTTPFWTGGTISTKEANYDGRAVYGAGEKGENRQMTVEVGSFESPNPWGLHDFHGNVWEWVEDRFSDSYDGLPIDGIPNGETGYTARVLRGGSWNFDPKFLRSAYRYGDSPELRSYYFGFRLSRALTP
ncbi:MAG: SUMF1/EgtB/PvdO family nonheme iron enzyme [Hyphomicrobiales bacterium]